LEEKKTNALEVAKEKNEKREKKKSKKVGYTASLGFSHCLNQRKGLIFPVSEN